MNIDPDLFGRHVKILNTGTRAMIRGVFLVEFRVYFLVQRLDDGRFYELASIDVALVVP